MLGRSCCLATAVILVSITVSAAFFIRDLKNDLLQVEPKAQKLKLQNIIEYEQLQIEGDVAKDDIGHGLNCGANDTQLTFSWMPKVIDPRGSVRFNVSFVLPVEVKNITATVDIHVYGDENPIFTIIQYATCDDLREELHKHSKIDIKCPLQKRTPFKSTSSNKSLTRLPTGNFTVIAKVLNENKKEILCLNVTLEVRRNY